MYIAIDIGSGLTKVVHNDGEFYFPSAGGVLKSADHFEYGIQDHEIIHHAKKIYAVGNAAYSSLAPEHREQGYSKHYWDKDIQLVYLYSAIAKIHPNGFEGTIALFTGLPISIFTEAQKPYLDKLIGEHHFTNKAGDAYSVIFAPQTTKIAPQAAGLHFATLAANPRSGIEKLKVGYIDPGTYTTGFAIVENNTYVHRLSYGENVGLEKLAKRMKVYFKEQHNWEPQSIEQILKALRDGYLDIYNADGSKTKIDMREVARLFVPSIYTETFKNIVQKWDGARDTAVYVSSGGGEYIIDEVRKHIPHAQLMHIKKNKKGDLSVNDDAFFDVARGYAVFAKNLVKLLPASQQNIVKIG